VLLAPLDVVKLPHSWFVGIVCVLAPGLVFLGVVGYLRWDLVTAFQSTPLFSEGVRIAIFILMAAASGLLISLVGIPLVVFYFIGYIFGYLTSKQIAKSNSRNMLWRRMAISFVGDQLVRLEEPALSEADFKAEGEKIAKAIPAGTPQEKIIETLVKAAGLQVYRGQKDDEWTQMYQVLESYFHPSSQDNLTTIGLLQSVGLAVACALVLCRTPNQSLLIIVTVLATATSTLLLALVGFGDGRAYPGEVFQTPTILRAIKSVTTQK
jgi:hypothetical protein